MLIKVKNLRVSFRTRGRILHAVNNVSLDIKRGETLGLVGESGSGKSTLGKAILRFTPRESGSMLYEGVDIGSLSSASFFPFRQKMQMIFQDPYASLNPQMRVGEIVAEGLVIHKLCNHKERSAAVEKMLGLVKLDPSYMNLYPQQLSGGQRQRVVIARALAVRPEFLFCDEPVSALDVTHQSAIVELLQDLQRELGLTTLFVSHDLSVVKLLSHRIAVMYLGEIVEIAPTEALGQHPYTQALLSSIAMPDPNHERKRKRMILKGDIPNPYAPPQGCPFHPRCPKAQELCRREKPSECKVADGHYVRCHFA